MGDKWRLRQQHRCTIHSFSFVKTLFLQWQNAQANTPSLLSNPVTPLPVEWTNGMCANVHNRLPFKVPFVVFHVRTHVAFNFSVAACQQRKNALHNLSQEAKMHGAGSRISNTEPGSTSTVREYACTTKCILHLLFLFRFSFTFGSD